MYYTVKRKNASTRAIGAGGVLVALFGTGYAIANGFGLIENKGPVESEVVIIEQQEEVKDEPPPPPPVDVDLPPPPPQVILPDFVFDTPPPQENAIQQVQAVKTPSPPPPPAPKAAPPPPPVLKSKPQMGRRFKVPDYPAASKRAGESGQTVIAMCVSKDGRTSNVRIVKSSGFDRLDDAAVKGLNNNRFEPAIDQYGKPIEMCDPNPYVFTYVWDLKDSR
jgi:protein TonB